MLLWVKVMGLRLRKFNTGRTDSIGVIFWGPNPMQSFVTERRHCYTNTTQALKETDRVTVLNADACSYGVRIRDRSSF